MLLFLQYKNAEYSHSIIEEQHSEDIRQQFGVTTFPFLVHTHEDHKEIFENSLHALREIEAEFPHPIGFIGPVESILQSTAMLFPKDITIKKSENISIAFSHIFESIIEKLEYSDFLMGPTFTVADCVLAGDLKAMQTSLNAKLPPELSQYILRVENKCK